MRLLNKRIWFLCFFLIALFGIVIFVIINGNAKMAVNRFSRIISDERINDIRLRIYYLDPLANTRLLSIEQLIESAHQERVVVEGYVLKQHIDLLRLITSDLLIPARRSGSRIDTRIYYVFEKANGEKIFDVAMWMSGNGNILINGREYLHDNLFHELIIPFLSENEAGRLRDIFTPGFNPFQTR